MSLSHLITTYGYMAVFVIVGLESAGVPVPSETALIAAAGLAGATHLLSPWLIVAAAIVANALGGLVGYWVGVKGGYPFLRRYGHRIWLGERQLKVARYLFDSHGDKVLFVARFISVLRTYAAFAAGVSKMPPRRFLAANTAAGVVWAGVITAVCYPAGHAVLQLSGPVGWLLAIVTVAGLAVGLVLARRRVGELAARAEAAYPGPLE